MRSVQKLPVSEIFFSVQGEGYHSGVPAWFIRLAGCDVYCRYCDTPDAWEIRPEQYMCIEDICRRITAYAVRTVIVTGGEPLCHDLSGLSNDLKKEGFCCHLETSGTHELTGKWDWICLSPKKEYPPLSSFFSVIHELKVIIASPADFLWAQQCAEACNKTCRLFLQPEWSQREKILPEMMQYIQQYPQWRLSFQTHKFMGFS